MKRHNIEITEKLNYLSKLPDTDFPFITLYLNVNSQEFLYQNEKNRIFIKNAIQEYSEKIKAQGNNHWKGFQKDVDKIEKLLDKIDSKVHGVAIFACENLGVWEVFESFVPFENEFIVNSFAHLKQLAYQGEELKKSLVIMFDSRFSKIFEVKLGGLIFNKEILKSDVHRFHKQGGWAQMKYQRGIEFEKEQHYKETARKAQKLWEEDHYDNIILVGQDYEAKNFQKHLSKKLLNSIIAINDLQMYENINVVLENIMQDLHIKEKEEEKQIVEEIVSKTQSQNGATVGIEDIIELVKDGRVETLALIKNQSQKGLNAEIAFILQKDNTNRVVLSAMVIQKKLMLWKR